jgi:hypothetical protein
MVYDVTLFDEDIIVHRYLLVRMRRTVMNIDAMEQR